MKKILVLAFVFFCFTVSFAIVPVITPVLKASDIFIPIGKTGQKISLVELSRINIKDLELLRGEKMSFFDRLGFRIAQKKLRNNTNHDGTVNSRNLVRSFTKDRKGKGGGLGGFVLGCLLGPVGVLIAYLIKDDHKKNRVTWAWIGCLAFLPFWLLFYMLAMLISG